MLERTFAGFAGIEEVAPTGALIALWRPGAARWVGTVGVADPASGHAVRHGLWAHQLGTGGLLDAATARQRLTLARELAPGTAYGIGVIGSHGWIGHAGGINGYSTYVGSKPAFDTALVFSINWGDTGNLVGPLLGAFDAALATRTGRSSALSASRTMRVCAVLRR